VIVGAGRWQRCDAPIEIDLNFTEVYAQAGLDAALDPRSVEVVEVDLAGRCVGDALPGQFDPAEDFDAHSNAVGKLTFLAGGTTAEGQARNFQVYFGPNAEVGEGRKLLVRAGDDGLEYEGQSSIKIETPAATYYYHKAGAGFAGIIDTDGLDWIGYRPGGRSAGEFRGIPNLVHPEGYFHPGGTECRSELVANGPVRAAIRSETQDRRWAVRWDVFPAFARLTVLKAPRPYWFLYEGTPGGKLDEERDSWTLSNGQSAPAAVRWETRLATPRWVYFTDGATGRIIYFAHHADDGDVDSYWPMEQNMTVFGFGRRKLASSLTKAPARFTVGLAEPADADHARGIIHAAFEDMPVQLGRASARP